MLFTDAEKTDIRRHCGYPAYGAGAAGFQAWRFYQAYGLLEYRMNNLSDAEAAVVRRYLASLSALEDAIIASSNNLDTKQAAVWTRNPSEVKDRQQLFDDWRRRLCGFLGVPPGPQMRGSGITLLV
ncbi:MAG: hypothetical protein JOY71_19740 [Acetobacteraceae bacterium]|nr:hypothetical protein [Acetobacteraceae bacterium]MBV8590756.1 hypothetical protein [Acetobacteraceae bacterium]